MLKSQVFSNLTSIESIDYARNCVIHSKKESGGQSDPVIVEENRGKIT